MACECVSVLPVKFPNEAFDPIPRYGVAHLFTDRNTNAAAVLLTRFKESDKVPVVDPFSVLGQMTELPAFQNSVGLGKPLPV